MGNLTFQWLSDNIVFIVGLAGGLYAIYKGIKAAIEKMLAGEFKSLHDGLGNLQAEVKASDEALGVKIDKLDMHTCKNFIVRFLSDVERGSMITEPEKQRFFEEYDHYVNIGGNSYVKEWYERLRKKGLL